MTRVYAKPRNGAFILSLANSTRSLGTVSVKADDAPYEAGAVLIDETDAEGDATGVFIRAAEATAPQVTAATKAVLLSDRTYAEAATSVLVVERDAEVVGAMLDSTTNAAVVAKLAAAGIILR